MVTVKQVLKSQAYLAAGVGLLPVLPFLHSWVLGALLIAFCLGLLADFNLLKNFPERLCTLLSIAALVVFVIRFSLTDLATPLLEFLAFLLAVRLAGPKTPRYILQIFLLASIILAGSSMLSLESVYLVYLIILIFLVTTGLVFLSFLMVEPPPRLGLADWRSLLKVSLLLPIGSLLLMLFFFIILPRTQTPLWNFLNPETKASTGISDEVKPGSVSDLTSSSAIAFRAETDPIPENQLYWRAIVFSRLEGQSWHHEAPGETESISISHQDTRNLTLYTEPKTDIYLPALDRPIAFINGPGNWITLGRDGTLQLRRPNEKKYRYEIQVQMHARSSQVGDHQRYLQVPETLSERTRQAGTRLRQYADFSEKIGAIDQFFQSQQLSYSATRLPVTKDPLDTFLFVSKRGYCEYFASSYALLLRLAGVPTRLVGGYLGGEYNPLGGYYLITQEQAHIWVEALDDNGLWTRIDPSRLAINSNEAFRQNQRLRISSLTAVIDLLEHNWSQFVLNYDLRQQFALLKTLTHSFKQFPSSQNTFLASPLWLVTGAGLLIIYLGWRRWHQPHKYLLRSYLKTIVKLNHLKNLPLTTGLYDLAQQTNEPLCQRFAEIYGHAIYQDRELTSREIAQLKQIIRSLKSLPRA